MSKTNSYILKFKALSRFQCRMFVVMTIVLGLIATTVAVFTLIWLETNTDINITSKRLLGRPTIWALSIMLCFVFNQTDYSRIRFVLKDNRKYVFYVGLCHMLNKNKQIILEDIDVLNRFFTDFHTETNCKKGNNTIMYTRKVKQ